MTDRELLQMALDALEEAQDYTSCPTYSPSMTQQCAVAAVALRARLALPEPAECDGGQCGIGGYCKQCPKTQLEQEPVAWGIANTRPTEKQPLMMVMLDKPEPSHLVVALYTAPPQREWVGLTDEEIREGNKDSWVTRQAWESAAWWAEAKLKEKNT
jgi:hypothetical protein